MIFAESRLSKLIHWDTYVTLIVAVPFLVMDIIDEKLIFLPVGHLYANYISMDF